MHPSGPPDKKPPPGPSRLRNEVPVPSDANGSCGDDIGQFYLTDEIVPETQLADPNTVSNGPAAEQVTPRPVLCLPFSSAAAWDRDPVQGLNADFTFAPPSLQGPSTAKKASPKERVATSDPATLIDITEASVGLEAGTPSSK